MDSFGFKIHKSKNYRNFTRSNNTMELTLVIIPAFDLTPLWLLINNLSVTSVTRYFLKIIT